MIVPMTIKIITKIYSIGIDLFIAMCYNRGMNKEITLPKYAVDQVVMGLGIAYRVKEIKSAHSGGYIYYGDNTSLAEEAITHLFNAGYWVPVEYWQSCREYNPEEISKDIYDEMLEEDPEETAFIEEQKKIFKETQALREEAKSDETKTKIEVQEES